MEYYLYVSQNKVDMLLPQISDKDKVKYAADIGVNVGVFKMGLKAERELENNNNIIARLKAVSKHISQSDEIGTIDSPNSWIEDTQMAKIIYLPEYQQVVFFIGESTNGVRFALGGSKGHLVSNTVAEKVEIGWSFLPNLLHSMKVMEMTLEKPGVSSGLAESSINRLAREDEFEWMDFLKVALGGSSEPSIKIKFLAKRLLEAKHPNDGTQGVLASPLYVAMVD